MAIGLGKMMGFHFPQNFNYPYLSRSVSEFWRRWHITLGSWFKSYVYFPLGGSRKGLLRTVINLAITWLLTGIWHGASWNFILWGVMYGIVIIIEKLVLELLKHLGKENIIKRIPAVIKHIYTMVLVILGWVLFDTDNISMAFSYMGRMFSFGSTFADGHTAYFLLNYGVLFLLAIIGSTNLLHSLADKLKSKHPTISNYAGIVFMVIVMLLSTAYLVDASYNPFLYFNF